MLWLTHLWNLASGECLESLRLNEPIHHLGVSNSGLYLASGASKLMLARVARSEPLTVLNSPGTIDADYRGEINVLLINHGREPFTIRRSERIAQMIVAPVTRAILVPAAGELSATARGAGGFGSTGR